MATWFNLSLIASELGEPLLSAQPWFRCFCSPQVVHRPRPPGSRPACVPVSLARAMVPNREAGNVLTPQPRLLLHIGDPLNGAAFLGSCDDQTDHCRMLKYLITTFGILSFLG
jgi:hypothetical protein